MKIAIVNSYFMPVFSGGAENSIYQLIKKIKEISEVEIVVISLSNIHDEIELGYFKGIKTYYIPYPYSVSPLDDNRNAIDKIIWYFNDYFSNSKHLQVREILEKESIDLVHTNNIAGLSSNFLNNLKSWNYPVVHTIRDYYFMCMKGNLKHALCKNEQGIFCSIMTKFRKKHSNLVDIVVGNSDFILNTHVSNGYFSDVSQKMVVYNGFEVQSDISLPKKRTYRIGYIGRICVEKGVLEMIEAVNSIAPHVEIILAGTGEEKYLKKLKQKHENLTFLGYVDSSTFYSMIDIVIVPSLWHEPLARTVFESYFYGLPVIGSDRGGIPESIKNGVNGFVYDPGKPKELEKYVDLLLSNDDEYHRMSSMAYELRNDFTVVSTAKSYLSIYEGLTSEGT